MEEKFFVQLKEYLLKHQVDNLKILIPYYETLLQMKGQLGELLDCAEKYNMDIRYNEASEDDWYSDGDFTIYLYESDDEFSLIPDHFEIGLHHDERDWGYCQCKPTDKGYDHNRECCGNGCDWTAPRIAVNKITTIAYDSFNGVENQLWELEKKWEVYTKNYNDKIKKRKIERIEEDIKELLKKKEELMNT